MIRFKDLRISQKLGLAMGTMLAAMGIVTALAIMGMRDARLEEKRGALRHEVDMALAILEACHAEESAGTLSHAQARALAVGMISGLGAASQSDVMLSDSETGAVVLHAARGERLGAPADGGTSGGQTPGGIAQALRAAPSGSFVTDNGIEPGSTASAAPHPTLTFVKRFSPWNLAVSTGFSLDDLDRSVLGDALSIGPVALLLLAMSGLACILIGRSISRPIQHATHTARAIAQGNIAGEGTLEVGAAASDEAGDRAGDRAGDTAGAKAGGEAGELLGALRTLESRLQHVLHAQRDMAAAHQRGASSHRIAEAGLPGVFGEMARAMNELSAGQLRIKSRLVEVARSYARGDFSVEMDRLAGEEAQITVAMNEVRSRVQAICEEVVARVDAAALGDFAAPGRAHSYPHDFRKVAEGLNRLVQVSQQFLDDLADFLAALARGNMAARITTDYPGAFGELKKHGNATAVQLSGLLAQIQARSENLNRWSREVAAGHGELRVRAEEQAVSVRGTASAMEAITATLRQSADNAKQANQLAMGASAIAGKGGAVVTHVVSTMQSIRESSNRIGEIIGVIDAIASQTTILALNAAVEAARAGEQGRGFAVVASEVRSLAQRSAAAAREIKELIGDAVAKMESGASLAEEAGATMAQVLGSVGEVSGIIGQITSATREQSLGIEAVNGAIARMEEVTKRNAALVEQSAATGLLMEREARTLTDALAVFRIAPESARGLSTPVDEASVRAATPAAMPAAAPPKPQPKLPPKPSAGAHARIPLQNGPHRASARAMVNATAKAQVSAPVAPTVAGPPRNVTPPPERPPGTSGKKLQAAPRVERRGPNRARNVARLPQGSARAALKGSGDSTRKPAVKDPDDDRTEI